MNIYKLLTISALVIFFASCGNDSDSKKDHLSIIIKDSKKAYKASDAISVSIQNNKNKVIDSVVYLINNERLKASEKNKEISISFNNAPLGQQKLVANVYIEGNAFETSKEIILLSSITPKIYNYKILETYPHDIEAYTQGLEFSNDTLYESTGQYNKSSLRKTNYITGEVLDKVKLEDHFFGEGLTVLNDKIYQLTWKSNAGFIYNKANLKKTGSFVYGKSKQGWGLCNDGSNIYKSDGSEKIWKLNANTLAEESFIEVYTNTSKIDTINELEWVNNKIYANIYQKDAIAIVNPNTGAVEGVINLKGLKEKVTQHGALDVLNGIAYKGEENILYVTGKNWDKLFKIEILQK
jgi:glutamine cyclotransferase